MALANSNQFHRAWKLPIAHVPQILGKIRWASPGMVPVQQKPFPQRDELAAFIKKTHPELLVFLLQGRPKGGGQFIGPTLELLAEIPIAASL
jgi:hypothetical protein